jgi:hypothetical protein
MMALKSDRHVIGNGELTISSEVGTVKANEQLKTTISLPAS